MIPVGRRDATGALQRRARTDGTSPWAERHGRSAAGDLTLSNASGAGRAPVPFLTHMPKRVGSSDSYDLYGCSACNHVH